ncbi:UNVERIFIED_CONTAM: hypothetical protein FKN15_062050 [Acipenser sinensis]
MIAGLVSGVVESIRILYHFIGKCIAVITWKLHIVIVWMCVFCGRCETVPQITAPGSQRIGSLPSL